MAWTTQYGIWKDEIVEGHGRLIACKELGYTEVPIIRLDHLSDEERKAYTLAHNKLTMNSDFDLDILNDELDDILNIDMSDFGFDLDVAGEIERDDLSDKLQEKYEIIIIKCKDEMSMQEAYEKLTEEGYECRLSTL